MEVGAQRPADMASCLHNATDHCQDVTMPLNPFTFVAALLLLTPALPVGTEGSEAPSLASAS